MDQSHENPATLKPASVSTGIPKAGTSLDRPIPGLTRGGGAGPPSVPFVLASGQRPLHFQRMQSHEVLREVLQTTSAKQVAADLGLSLSMIYKWAEPADEPTSSGAANPLDRIEALLRSTGDLRIVHWLCQRAGGFFIHNPKITHPHPDYLIPATNQIIQEFADLLAVVANAAGDNYISAGEAEKIRARWEELKSVTEEFVHCCEQGNFRPIRERAETAVKSPK